MTSTPGTNPHLPPNHHAAFPPFGGVVGLVAAVAFTIGRGSDADLAIALTGADGRDDVVDIGCGPGVAARRLAASGGSVTGVDPAAAMVRVGRALTRRTSTARYLEGTAESLPLADGSASVVWALSSVHHWGDLDAGLREVRRVLRPSGRFLAVERWCAPGATGRASHGWTEDQAQLFADQCEAAGLRGVEVARHPGRRRTVLSVLAHVPPGSLT